MRTSLRGLIVVLLLPFLVVEAQGGSATPKWSAWFGCWTPVDAAGLMLAICAVPGRNAETVEIASVVNNQVVERRTIAADGTARPTTVDGCEGTESATFSSDGQRVFITGEMQCAGGPAQSISGVMSISESGEWIEVRGTRVGDQHDMRVSRATTRHHLIGMPAEVRALLEPLVQGARAGLIAARVPLTPDRVIEAASAVDERVVEAWMVESSTGVVPAHPATSDDLLRLANGQVADRVIDAYVALGYPKFFAVAEVAPGDGEARGVRNNRRDGYGRYEPQCFYDYTYECYGYGSRLEWYRDAYSRWGSYSGRSYPGPIIFVIPRDASGGGRVVKGRGYTPRTPSSGTPATPRANEGSANWSGGSAGGAGAATPAANPAPRTAKPRNP